MKIQELIEFLQQFPADAELTITVPDDEGIELPANAIKGFRQCTGWNPSKEWHELTIVVDME